MELEVPKTKQFQRNHKQFRQSKGRKLSSNKTEEYLKLFFGLMQVCGPKVYKFLISCGKNLTKLRYAE